MAKAMTYRAGGLPPYLGFHCRGFRCAPHAAQLGTEAQTGLVYLGILIRIEPNPRVAGCPQ